MRWCSVTHPPDPLKKRKVKSRMEELRLTYQEYWGYYWRVVHRHKIPGIFKWDQDLVDLIEKQCALKPGASVLDLGCGGGDQAKLFARKGYRVVGIDKVRSLIEFATDAFKKEGLSGEFHTADMRGIKYQNEFDLCVMLSGTFGLPAEKENEQLLQKIHRALKADGQAFIDYLPLVQYSKLSHTRSCNTIDDGFSLREEWFDAPTSTYRTKHIQILLDGKIIRPAEEAGYGADEIIRCYGVREIEDLAERTGYAVKAHLARKQIGNPDYIPEASEPRGMLILEKRN
jgi:ubiquinone/menaquinone biosynthesis C-methylase UbiE